MLSQKIITKKQMKMKKTNAFIVFILLSTILIAQDDTKATFIAKYGEKNLDIHYEKWELPNGLTVIVHEDHSDPIVHVRVAYHAGSSRESQGRTGYAHFFEHMLCGGTEHAGEGEHFNLVKKNGGVGNAFTSYDETVYFATVPSNLLERMLFLESDRMGYAYNVINQNEFEVQRELIKEEKLERYHQQYGMLNEVLFQSLFPPDHPYNWPIIGYVEDLDRAKLSDMKNFLLRWYSPNNATLIVSGDVNVKEVISLSEKYFSNIPRGENVRNLAKKPVRLSSDKYTSYLDPYAGVPLTALVFPTVPKFHKDEAALNILADILGGGNSSRFYQKFVKTEEAYFATCTQQSMEIAGMFYVYFGSEPNMEMLKNEGTYFNDVEKKLRETLLEFEKEGFTDDELQRSKNKIQAMFVDKYETTTDKAQAIMDYHYKKKSKINVSDELNSYLSVSREDINKVYKKYIQNKHAVILNVKVSNPFTTGKDTLVSYNPYMPINLTDDPQYQNLSYNRPKDNSVDRNNPQEIPKANKIVMPEYYTDIFNNGLKIIGTTTDLPVVYMKMTLNGGELNESKRGAASITASLLNESTKNFSTESISKELEILGSNITFSANKSEIIISLFSLDENIDKTLDLLSEKLFNPGFNEDDFSRIKKDNIQSYKDLFKNKEEMASNILNEKMFGDNAYGGFTTEKDIKKLKLKDVKKYYDKAFAPNISNITIVSSYEKTDIISKLSMFNSWKKKNVEIPGSFTFPEAKPTEIYIYDIPGATQSAIRIGHRSLKYSYNDMFYKNQIMNYSLGDGFISSRLELNLREDKGFTYGIGSRFIGDKIAGKFLVFSNIRTSATDSALTEILFEIENYVKKGITTDELKFVKQTMLNSKLMGYESNRQKLNHLSFINKYSIPKNYIVEQQNITKSIEKEDIDKVAKANIHVDNLIIVIAGNKYVIKKKLENLTSKDGRRYNFKVTEIKY